MATKIVRRFSPCGPCLTEGRFVRETAKFIVYNRWISGDRFDAAERKIIKSAVHIVPCRSCTDYPATMYPNGYMD